ncbi:thioesterase family protein [Mycolicibacterium sp. 3033]|nr:thioesterase family protein [Mycolicibacterium aurantiacum]
MRNRSDDGDDSSIDGEVNHAALIDRLTVHCAETRCKATEFVGKPIAGFRQRTYGGHLVAQAVLASAATLESHWVVNSLHAYFLRPGVHDAPLRYSVTTTRDGRAASVRSVRVAQEGRELATVDLLYGLDEDSATAESRSVAGPDVPGPDDLAALHERREQHLPPDGINRPTGRNWRTASRPLDIRYIDDDLLPADRKHQRCFWFRAEPAAMAIDRNTERAILAFASDRSLLPAIAKVRGELSHPGQWPVASLDHCVWFHADVTAGRWYLYTQDSPFSTAGGGFARGVIYDENRAAVASVAQQGLIVRS